MKKLGDEYYAFIVDCVEPKACTILLRGASKDVLNEVRIRTSISLDGTNCPLNAEAESEEGLCGKGAE